MIYKAKEKVFSLSQNWGKKIGLDLPYFVKNGFWVVLRQGIGLISGLALSVAFARLSTQDVFGQYQFILSILSIVSILSIPGLNTSIIKSAARGYDGDYKKVVRVSFIWSLLGVPALLIVGGYYYIYQSHLLGIALMISSIFFPFFYAPNTWDSFLQGKSRFDISTKYGLVQSIINALATIAVVFFFRDNLLAIIIVYLFSFTFFNGYYYWKSLKYIENNKKDKETVKYGWFLTKINILGTISNNIDKVLIGIFLSHTELAIYSIGILFTQQIQNFSKSFLSIVSPKQIKHGNISRNIYFKIFFGSVIITLCFLLVLKFIIPILFSSRYNSSIFLSYISMIFYPFFIIATIYSNQFIFDNKKNILLKQAVIVPAIKILLSFIVLPIFKLKGLAFLFGFQYFIIFIVLYALGKRLFFSSKNSNSASLS